MTHALIALSAVVVAYLLGSIPFAVVSSRLFGLADPRSYGSKIRVRPMFFAAVTKALRP